MSSSVLNLPSRVDIRQRDNASGSLPTIFRTSVDNRTGKYPAKYVDNDVTISFLSQTLISLPTTLPDSYAFLNTNHKSDITFTGAPQRGAIDNFVIVPKPGQEITPFDESTKIEAFNNSAFYASGTKPDQAANLSSALKSKTYILLRGDMTGTTAPLFRPTSSVAFFDWNNASWRSVPSSITVGDVYFENLESNLGVDFVYFDSFGNMYQSQSFGDSTNPALGQSVNTGNTTYHDSFEYLDKDSMATFEGKYSARDGEVYEMSEILPTSFVVEKAVVEMSLECSSSWMDLKTTIQQVEDDSYNVFFDMGGPALTVALFRQQNWPEDKRELICSGTIIPGGDDVTLAHTPNTSSMSALTSYTSPKGFTSFATPNVIIESNQDDGGFEGKIKLEMIPHVSNGFITWGSTNAASFPRAFPNSFIEMINPLGRAGAFEISGRSLLTRDWNYLSNVNDVSINFDSTDILASGTANKMAVYNAQKQSLSPYILNPEDNIVLSIGSTRPAIDLMISGTLTGSFNDKGIGNASVWPAMGEVTLKLYGSFLKNEVEYHDSLNQLLTSDALHEAIGDGVSLDYFDTESKLVFSGSYVDDNFLGLIDNTSSGSINARRVIFSSVGSTPADREYIVEGKPGTPLAAQYYTSSYDNKSFALRHPKMRSKSERYYDTVLPRVDNLATLLGYKVVESTNIITSQPASAIILSATGSGLTTLLFDWDRSFPFEPRLSSASRVTSFLKEFVAVEDTVGVPIAPSPHDELIVMRGSTPQNPTRHPTNAPVWFGLYFDNDGAVKFPTRILGKNLFGFGDNQGNGPKVSVPLSSRPNPTIFDFYADVDIRGYKYGVLSGDKIYRSAVYRRDRYGHFADRMEQGLDSKYLDEESSTLIPSPVQVKFVFRDKFIGDGEQTFSSNVSFEATSSLPYFDGMSLNRGALPDTSIIP